MMFMEARLALAAVLMAVAAATTSRALGSGSDAISRSMFGFVGPAITPASTATRSDAVSAAKKIGLSKVPATEQGTSADSPLARRVLLRRARGRPRSSVATEAPQRQQDHAPKDAADSKGGADVGNLFRMEVAQRMKEMKLMTQPGLGPLAPAGGLSAPGVLAAPKLDGDAAALEGQIALLTNRIKSIDTHLQRTPTDAVSRKGLVVLVKRRRALLETLRHRDHDRWLATTESLGLRQRADASTGEQLKLAARRARRRDRGRRRRREKK